MSTAEPQMRSGDMEDEDLGEELLPCIPNDVTLYVITPRLSWRDVFGMSTTSRSWEQAIRGRLVQNARLLTHSAETLAVVAGMVAHDDGPEPTMQKLYLYSMRDNTWCDLPPIPGLAQGIPCYCRCVSFDGKIYVLGGREHFNGRRTGSKKVYMLDLLGQGQWKPCASMHDRREDISTFGSYSGVIDGKIYCFGANVNHRSCSKSEMYDPKADAWSRIKPMMSARSHHRVVTIGSELVVHGGNFHELAIEQAGLMEAYHPTTDEWRLIQFPTARPQEDISGAVFVAGGKFHVITSIAIYVYDIHEHSRTLLQSCSFPEFGPVGSRPSCHPIAAVHIDDELLVAIYWIDMDSGTVGRSLLRSRRFGHQNTDIVWEKVKCPCCDGDCGIRTFYLMGSIQL